MPPQDLIKEGVVDGRLWSGHLAGPEDPADYEEQPVS